MMQRELSLHTFPNFLSMLFVALSILCSVLLGFIFKLFPRFGVDSFQAIVFNYLTCVGCGWVYLGAFPIGPATGQVVEWLPYALGLGGVFITGFTAAARTVREFGVTISQIMQKMTILVVVPFAIVVLGESSGVLKWLGTVFAIAAIVLVNLPAKNTQIGSKTARNVGLLWLPVVTWLLSCVIDTAFVWVQNQRIIQPGDIRFITTVFATAGCIGLATVFFGWIRGTLRPHWRNVVGGVVLGIPNFGSLSFLLMALGSGLEGSLVFPMVNVGIILVTTFGALVLFREKLSTINWFGVALAVAAIFCIAVGS
jgi:drug/metabolite transporter (DMT)-like permease